MSYADFEGTIPPGQYGAGHVIVWDRGTWTPLNDPREGLAAGKLSFELHGEKLEGVWELVRLKRPDERKETWLLFKKRDEFAKPHADYDVVIAKPDSVITAKPLEPVARKIGPEARAAARNAVAPTGHPRHRRAAVRHLVVRTQVRRLPGDDPLRTRRAEAHHPRWPRLDRTVARAVGRAARTRDQERLAGRRTGGAQRRRHPRLQRAAERVRPPAHRAHRLLPVRRAVPRRPGPARRAAGGTPRGAEGPGRRTRQRPRALQRRHRGRSREHPRLRLRDEAGRRDRQAHRCALRVAPQHQLAQAQVPAAAGVRDRGLHRAQERRRRNRQPAARPCTTRTGS